MEKRIATLQEQIEMTKIVAPINGSVEDVPFKIGQAVSPGITVFRIVNFSKVKVVADIAETYANKVKKDNPLMIYFPDIAKEVEAKVSFASKFISPVNRTFNIEARIDGDNIEYKANMIAIVKINDYLNENAIVVPVNVVQSDPKGKFIYAIENKNNKLIATKRYINEGLSYNGLVEIKNGINFNDKIIISNFQNVDNGVVVKAL
jgi:RND family efflux transporter MFP subunit